MPLKSYGIQSVKLGADKTKNTAKMPIHQFHTLVFCKPSKGLPRHLAASSGYQIDQKWPLLKDGGQETLLEMLSVKNPQYDTENVNVL